LRIIRLPGGRPLCLSRKRTWTPSAAAGPGGRVRLEAVALGGPVSLVDDAGRMASELVASAIRHTDAPVELTVDAGDDMVRIEVRDDDASLPGTGRVVSFELREASTAV
jgi:signal transduction histidine kinase